MPREVVSTREPRRLPVVLSPEEVARLLASARNIKHKALLSLAYATGLRSSEVVSLKLTDIDSDRMVIRVEQGKGKKDRYVILSPNLLDLLREWWRVARKKGWMAPGQRWLSRFSLSRKRSRVQVPSLAPFLDQILSLTESQKLNIVYWCRLQLQDVVFSRASTSGSGDRNGRGIKRGK